jgi:hypothetical protein
MLIYFMALWSILRPFGIFCGHSVYLMVIWYSFSRFVMLYQEKSGNPAAYSVEIAFFPPIFFARKYRNKIVTLTPGIVQDVWLANQARVPWRVRSIGHQGFD